jgi:hypothetical protein
MDLVSVTVESSLTGMIRAFAFAAIASAAVINTNSNQERECLICVTSTSESADDTIHVIGGDQQGMLFSSNCAVYERLASRKTQLYNIL